MNILKTTATWLTIALVAISTQAFAQLNADFSVNKQKSCSPLIVSFNDQSTGNPTSWRWKFGNGNSSTQQNPGAIYVSPGDYTVTLIVSDGSQSDTITKTDYLTVFHDPVADFTVNKTRGCTPMTVQFTEQSQVGSAGIQDYSWDFGNGQNSFQRNTSETYANPGNYSVTLLVVDSNSCKHEKTIPNLLKISEAPTAQFTGQPTNKCEPPLSVNFTNQSTSDSPLSYQWNLGNGTSSTTKAPSETYTSYGAYDVQLTVTDTFGCTDRETKNNFVTINELQAGFTVNTQQACQPGTFQFTDTTSPTPDQWMWDFGDGATSSQQNPSHTYSSTGTYAVKLIAMNNTGCSDSIVKQNYVTVNGAPNADFSASQTKGCQTPFATSFTDQSTNAVTWSWSFGDGDSSNLQNPSHTYSKPGNYTVSLTVTNSNGCQATRTRSNYISIVEPEANFDADNKKGCLPLSVNFTDQSTSNQSITSWFWEFGDSTTSTAQNPSHTYTQEGKYDVSLVIQNASGCIDTLFKKAYIQVGDTPSVDFTANPLVSCLNEGVTFTSQANGGDQYFWSFGDGGVSTDENPTYEYGDTGRFTITHVALNNGCPDTMIKQDYIRIFPPNAVFNVVQSCTDPFEVNLVDQSLDPDHWQWTFGDGDTVNTPNPSAHTYDSSGQYSIGLTVLDTISGCTKHESKTITIADPQAQFKVGQTVGCAPHTISLMDSSVDADSYLWITDSNSFNGANPTYTYQEPGVYDVTLIITDANGCQDTLVRNNYITVNGPTPAFSATPRNGCAPLTVQFSDSSTAFNGSVTDYFWQFGNGDTSKARNPVHHYHSAGSYDVSLTVFDDNGCSKTIQKSNYIQPTFPDPEFTADTLTCSGQAISFTNQSNGQGLSYLWQFGDGDTSVAENPIHSYDQEGQYDISLKVTDVNGCDTSITKPNYVTIQNPRADFVSDSGFAPCPPFLVHFEDSSSSDITGWEWHFGDGSSSTLEDPSHVYTEPGNFDVTLIATSKFGCKDTMHKPDFTVVQGPNGDFDFDPAVGCQGMQVQFNATTTNTALRTWDFGDGNVKQDGDTTTHVYTSPGTYHPVLILDDGLGCTFSLETDDSVTVGNMNAKFTANKKYLCKSGVIQFGNLSNGFPTATDFTWHFGDGGTSFQENPMHTYTSPGLYDVQLIASNGICTDTLEKQSFIHVDDGPQANFGMQPGQGCLPLQVQFTDSTVADTAIASWEWDFGNDSTSAQQHPSITFRKAGTYNVQLIVTSAKGCPDTISKPLTVHPLPNADAGANQVICKNDSAQLNASGGASYSWSPTTGLSDPSVASPTASPASTTTYEVTVTSANGCQDVDSVTVSVNPLPKADAGPDFTICTGDAAQLNASGGSAYTWSNGSVLSDPNISDPLAMTDSSATFTVTVTDTNGCSAIDSTNLTVHQLPQADAGPDFDVCIGQAAQLNASGGVDYRWSPSATLSDSTIADPMALPKNTTTYHVTVTDANGCSATDSATVTVHSLPTADAGNDQTICVDDSAQLNASGGVSYAWSPAKGLSDTSVASPKASPATTTSYQVKVTNTNGCVAVGSVTVHVNPLPPADAGPSFRVCKGSGVLLNASGGSSYSWSNPGLLSDPNVHDPLAVPQTTTTFTVTVTDSNGCSAMDSTQIDVNPLPPADAGPSLQVCDGQATQLNGSGGRNYHWTPTQKMNDPHSQTPIVEPDTTTTYFVRVTDTNGCSAIDSTIVTVNPLPTAETGKDTAICSTQTAQLSASGGVSYQWSPSGSLNNDTIADPVASPQSTTSYQVTVTDSNGCVDVDDVQVQVKSLPPVHAGVDEEICKGDSVSLSGTGQGGFSWSPSSSLSCSNCKDPIASPQDTTEYVLQVTGANQCVARDTVQVDVHSLPSGVAYPDTTICEQESVVLHAEGGVAYKWSPAKGLSNIGTATTVASPATSTQYVVRITNKHDCFVYDTVDVIVNQLPDIDNQVSDDTTICRGESVQLAVQSGYSYQWTPANSLSCDTCSNPLATPSETTEYMVTAQTSQGCSVQDSVKITVNPVPDVEATSSTTICLGEEAQIQASSSTAQSFAWTPASSLTNPSAAQTKATPDATTIYEVEARNQHQCSATDTVKIQVIEQASVDLQNDTAICVGESIRLEPEVLLKGQKEVSYQWLPADAFDKQQAEEQIVSPETTTRYTLIAENGKCIPDTQQFKATVNPLPEVDLGEDRLIIANSNVDLTVQTDHENSIQWKPQSLVECADCRSNTIRPENSLNFQVAVTDENECVGTDTISIDVLKNCAEEIYVPNTFTPNGDQHNDMLYVRGRTIKEVKFFRVYNRWGELMFESNDKGKGWDGRYRGEPLNPGVFVYHLKAVCNNGQVVSKKGNVTIVK